MMLKPSIDSLLDRVNSKYSLVILASKRAHELDAGAQATLEQFDSVKSVGQAARAQCVFWLFLLSR